MRVACRKVRGRSAAPGWLGLVVAGGGPPFPQQPACGHLVLAASPGSGWPGRIRGEGKGMLAGLALVSAALQPVDRASAGAAGCWVQGASVAELRHPLAPVCLQRFLVAVLRILGVRSSPSSPSVPPGPAVQEFPSGAPSSLISCGNFPHLALRVDRPPSAAEQASLPATKKQRGEKGSWPVT